MNYISVNEYLMSRAKLEDLPDALIANINVLIPRINDFLEHFYADTKETKRAVTSGYRRVIDNNAVPHPKPHSNHLICAAIDIEDVNGKLNKYCKNNIQLLESIGLWCEERQGSWQHFQIFPPASQHRWFIP